MEIKCPHCKETYDIPEERIRKLGAAGAHLKFPCPACKGTVEIKLNDSQERPASKPPPTPSSGGDMLTGEALKKLILRTVKDLPPMPQVAQKARRITADENSSFSDLAKVIETDQAIATRVLKIANSSYYGQAGKVTSLQQAAVVLGMKTLNELLTMACSGSMIGSELKGYKLQSGDLWMHSLATAGCARMLAEKKKPALADNAFSAGLIHDCGKLILDKYIVERDSQFENFLKDEQKTFLAAEKALLGFDHGQIAAEVCEKWQIPENLRVAIQYHHNPSAAGNNELVNIIHAADSIALLSGIGAGIDGMMYEIDKKVMDSLELNSDDIGLYMGEIAEYVVKTTSMT